MLRMSWRKLLEHYKERQEHGPPDKRLGHDARLSLLIHFFFQIGASMSGVFLNLYLWRLTGSIWINGMYNAINYGTFIIGFIVGGWIVKKKDRMYAYRLGLLMIALFYVCVVLAQEQVVHWYVLFAVFAGLSASFYWTGYLVLMYDVSDDRNRIHYLAMNMIFFTMAGLVGPALAGKIIASSDGLQGYILVFGISFAMFLIAALGSLRIGPKEQKHKAYYLKYTALMMKREPMWVKGLFAFTAQGLFGGIMLFLPNILLYQVMPHEDRIGYITVLFSLITIMMGTLISRYVKNDRVIFYTRISALGLIAASSLLLFGLQVWTVMGFMILYSFFAPLQGNMLTSYYYRMTGKLPLRGNFRVESVVVREIFINVGRVISILTLILLLSNVEGRQLAYILLAGSVIQLLLPLLLRESKPDMEQRTDQVLKV